MKPKKIPFRMCVGCQTMKSKKELMRVVRTPDGEIVLDPTGKKAGRGAYMCRSEQCLTKAFKEKRLEKALKHQVDEAVYNALKTGIVE
ncbi:RNase P modulator RnpM [Sporomusa aerivorans]|uniref:RNase P modulator RnpM n=1 Tax=Sporomusa aerivorans TaxID=204936 RepID=UPI003529DE6F